MPLPGSFFQTQDLSLFATLMIELPLDRALDLLHLDVHPWIVARPELFSLALQALAQGKRGRLEEKVLADADGDDMLFFVAQSLHHYRGRLGG